MTTAKQLRDLGKRLEVTLRQDESGQLHPFYAYSIPDTEEKILEVAGKIQGTASQRKANVEFFKNLKNLLPVMPRDAWAFGGRTEVSAMEYALYGMRAIKNFYFSEARTQSTPASNRCIAGNTIVSVDGRRVDEIDGPFQCWSWDGEKAVIAWAEAPFVKGFDQLYRVELETGESFEATAAHRVLTPNGWSALSELLRRFEQDLPVSISSSSRFARERCARHSTGTPSSSRCGCRLARHSHDGRPPSDRGVSQDAAPSQGDAQERIRSCERGDDLERDSGYSRQLALSGHLSSCGSSCRAERFRSGPKDQVPSPFSKRFQETRRVASQSGLGQGLSSTVLEESPHPKSASCGPSESISVRVLRILASRHDTYYDFHVPVFNNYFAAGVIQHNSGKTQARIQKVIAATINYDPLRPEYKFPFDASKTPLIGWSCVPARNTRQELMDLQRRIPPGYKHKIFTAKGDERIEFEPTTDRPFGSIVRIKSYGMPVDQFQREAVHWISMDERAPAWIWDECRMRLLSTNGWMILAMALYDLEKWLYEKNRKFASEFRNVTDGAFGWYSWMQMNCPWLDQEAVAEESKGLGEDARAARVFGEPRLLEGTAYFKPVEMLSDLWKKYSRDAEFELRFAFDGAPQYGKWSKRKGWRVWQQPIVGDTYAIGADVAKGLGGDNDYSTAHVLRIRTGEIVAVFESNDIEPDEFSRELYMAGTHFNNAIIAIERNVEQTGSHLWLRRYGYPRIYRTQTFQNRHDELQDSYGWTTTASSKNFALEALHVAIRNAHVGRSGAVILYDGATYDQLQDYGHLRETRRRAHGLGGLTGHDDLVMSLAITLQAATQAEQPKLVNVVDVFKSELDMEFASHFKKLEREQNRPLRKSRLILPGY